MASTAQVAQLSKFYVSGTVGSSITITGITKATSAVVTATNTLAVGDVVKFGAVTSMPEIKDLLGIVTVASGSSFTVAIDSSGFAAVGTSGTAIPQTFTKIANVTDFSNDGGSVSNLDKTNLDSTAKEFSPGLQDMGSYSLSYSADDTDVGQLALVAARSSLSTVIFKQVYPGGLKIRSFSGFVTKLSEPTAGVDKLLVTSASIKVTGPISRG